MKPLFHSFYTLVILILSCTNHKSDGTADGPKTGTPETINSSMQNIAGRHFSGAVLNGMKGDSIFFDVSADGRRLEQLTFKGYWRCDGKIEQTTAGPEGSFPIEAGKVKDHISEPPNGGSTAWRFELEADIQGNVASGNFRMNINNLGCDTYKLEWKATSN